jgi:hypothetical protein
VTCLLDDDRFPRGWESVIISIADRHVAQDFVSIDRRLDDMIERHPEYRHSIEMARRAAHSLEAQLADAADLDVASLLVRLRTAWQAE